MRKTNEDVLSSLPYREEVLIQIRGRNYKRFRFVALCNRLREVAVRTLKRDLLAFIDMKDITGVKIPND